MRKYIVIAILVVLGIILSVLLVPGSNELALMQFRDKRFEEARAAYEQRLSEGVLTVDVVSALTDLYLQYGDVEEAISVMQRFVEANPDNIEARKELGRLYQYAQRPDDYLRTLEEINRMEASGKSYQTLAEMYGASEQYEKQEPALEGMLAQQGGETQPQNYRYLANLQASQERIAEAVATLQKFKEVYPQEFNFDDQQLLVTLLLKDTARQEEAYEAAQAWAVASTSTAEIARLVNILHYAGSPQLGWRLISMYEQQVYEYPVLAVEKAYLHINLGEEKEAYELMGWLYENDKLPVTLFRDYMFLSLDRGNTDTALEVAERIDANNLSETDSLAFAELLATQRNTQLTEIVRKKFSEARLMERYEVLAAVMAVVEQKSDAQEKLDALPSEGMNNAQLLQIARICSVKKRSKCVSDFLARVNSEELTVGESVTIANLYLDTDNVTAAQEILEPLYAQNPDSKELSELRVKIAAAQGDTVFVDRWLSARSDVTESQYKAIFFTAQDRRQYDTSSRVAEMYHKQYASDESRNLLVNTYMAAKRYEAALPFLRELQNYSEQDRNDYLAVLMNLARKSPRYNAELAEFASKHLRSGNVPQRQKQSLIYALLEAGRADLALPFIREFAQTHGGEWVEIYAANLDKVGRHDEARDFRMQIAMDEETPDKTRREIGFLLLEHGYKEDALTVFSKLAASAPADSDDVKQLLYLWGPRLSDAQLDWLGYRAVNATDLTDQDRWAEYLTGYADAEALVSFMERNPEMAANPKLLDGYIGALQRLGRFREMQDRITQLAADTQNPGFLRSYARAAHAYDMPRLAVSTYGQLDQLVGGDPEAQRNIGLIAYTLADYSVTKDFLQTYADYRLDNERYHKDDYQAFFYLAHSYHRDDRDDLAKPHYEKVLELADMALEKTPDIISKTGQSLVMLGRKDEGYQIFEEGLLMYPRDTLLRADYVSTLIEQEDYAMARELAQTADLEQSAEPVDESQELPVSLSADILHGYRTFSDGGELLLEFKGIEGQDLAMDQEMIKKHPWVSYSTQGYDRALIVAKPSYRLTLQPTASGYMIIPERKVSEEEAKLQRDLKARYEMLQARIQLETGDHYQAAERLNEVMPVYSDNPTLIGYAANAENFVGRWRRALHLLEIAEEQMPENEDIQILKRDIRRNHGQHVKLDYEWFKQGDSHQNIWTVAGMAFFDDAWEVGVNLQHNDIEAESVTRIDGRTGNFDTTKQRGEVYVAHEDEEGTRIQASLFGNNDTFGFGGYYSWHHELGQTMASAEYHRPNWLFVEGVLDDATRDRIALSHNYRPNPKWLIGGGVSLNRYNVKGEDGVADSVGITGTVTRQLQATDPYLAVSYALDGEYRLGEKTFIDNNGTPFVPLLDGREVHTLSLIYSQDMGEDTDVMLQGGYSYERLGGDHGPLVAGELTQQMLEDQLEAQVRASYGAFTTDNVGDTARVGGHLKWRF